VPQALPVGIAVALTCPSAASWGRAPCQEVEPEPSGSLAGNPATEKCKIVLAPALCALGIEIDKLPSCEPDDTS